jgi:hypothetical protein
MNVGCPICSLPFLSILIFRITQQYRFMGLKYEPPSLVLALQIHELNGGSDAVREVIAEAVELLISVPEAIFDGATTLVNAGAPSDYVFCRIHVVLWTLPNDRDPVLMHNYTRSNQNS